MANKKIEPGAASIKIELTEGSIFVYHGTDKVLLFSATNVKTGTWDRIWKTINSIKSR